MMHKPAVWDEKAGLCYSGRYSKWRSNPGVIQAEDRLLVGMADGESRRNDFSMKGVPGDLGESLLECQHQW